MMVNIHLSVDGEQWLFFSNNYMKCNDFVLGMYDGWIGLLLKRTICVAISVSVEIVISFFFCGRGCICWWIFVTIGSREAH